MQAYILSVDVGTTTIRSVLYDSECIEVASYQEKVTISYSTGPDNEVLVEIDPDDLFNQFLRVIKKAYEIVPSSASVKVAMCTQRNSIVFWNRKTKTEETKIICWNDKRANQVCQNLNSSWLLKSVNTVGKLLYFITRKHRFLGAQRLKFLGAMVSHRLIVTISRSKELKQLHSEGDLVFGCLESWLLMRSSRENQIFVEASNISTSGMFDPWINDYNHLVLKVIGFPNDLLLPIVDSNFGDVKPPIIDAEHIEKELQIVSILADQQSAMFGCGAWEAGDVKINLGTGTFVDIHTGENPYTSMSGLYPIVGWRIDGKPEYMAEGNAHDTAVILHWAQTIGLFDKVEDTSDIANSVESTNGTVFVPAFCGIQTPINDETACSGFLALRPNTSKNHMVRAILESIAFRVYQIYMAAKQEVFINENSSVRICGGVSNNNFICQCIADLLNRKVERMENSDHVAARGVAMLAGYAQGIWSKEQLKKLIIVNETFYPNEVSRENLLKSFKIWLNAVNHCLGFFE